MKILIFTHLKMCEGILVVSLLLVFWTCVGYPWFLQLKTNKKNQSHDISLKSPFTIVMVVHNAENELPQKLSWLSSLQAPELDKIVIIDDGSDDATSQLLREWEDKRKVVLSCERAGKSSALNEARKHVTTPLVALMDVRQSVEEKDLRTLLSQVDSDIYEAVSGRVIFQSGSHEYWNLETKIRHLEGQLGSTIGLSGCLAVIKKSHWVLLPSDCLADDLALGLGVLAKQGRVGFNPDILVHDPIEVTRKEELKRKVRTLSGNWQILFQQKRYFLPREGFPWWALIQHKWLRLFLPLMLLAILISFLQANIAWQGTLLGLTVLLVLWDKSRMMIMAADFFWLNLAALVSFSQWKKLAQQGYWDPQGLRSK